MKKITVAVVSLFAVVSWSCSLFLGANLDGLGGSENKDVAKQVLPSATTQQLVSWSARSKTVAPSHKPAVVALRAKTVQPKVLGVSGYNVNQLSQEQAVSLAKPGVVSVINRLRGNISVPDFDVDLKTFALVPRTDLKPYVLSADDDGLDDYGSGFVVNSNGYIITNSHVVSKNAAYDSVLAAVNKHWNTLYKDEQDALSDKDYKSYNSYLTSIYGSGSAATLKMDQDIDAQVAKYLKTYTTDNLTSDVVVIDKSLKGQVLDKGSEFSEIYSKSLPATVVSFDPDFKKTGKDAALLKIDQNNVPTLPLGSSDNLVSGDKVLIFGYPYNAQVSNSDWFVPTLTEGIIGAVKQDSQGQKVIQLDNKISPGSSGGPLLDSHGNVVGIVTYETGNSSSGDSFGFALPVELAKTLMDNNKVTNDLGVYGNNFLLGLAQQDQSYCKKALDYFSLASSANPHFPVSDELSTHINACQSLIANSLSKDSNWDIIRLFYTQHQVNAVSLSLVLLAILGCVVSLLVYLFYHLYHRKIMPQVPMPKNIVMG